MWGGGFARCGKLSIISVLLGTTMMIGVAILLVSSLVSLYSKIVIAPFVVGAVMSFIPGLVLFKFRQRGLDLDG